MIAVRTLFAGANAPVLIVATLTHFRRKTSSSSRKVLAHEARSALPTIMCGTGCSKS